MHYLGGLRGSALNTACVLLVTFPAFMCYGYNQSVAGGLLTQPSFVKQFPAIDTVSASLTDAQKQYNSTIQGTVISLYTVGGIFGALSTSIWGDKLGRRNFIFASSALVMIGAILMASSFSLTQFIIARVILGFGTGAMSGTVPVWTSELSKIENRGSHTSSVGFFLSIGIALGLWIDLGLSFVHGQSVSWRFPLAFQILFCLVVMGFIYTLPESPRWLLTKGRVDEARCIMSVINDCDINSDLIVQECREIEHSLEVAAQSTMKDMFRMGETRILHRALLAIAAMFFSQICAINALTFYANTIFEQYLRMTPIVAQVLSGSMEIIQCIGAAAAMFTIDRFGRRPLMLFSGVGMCICMALLAGLTSNQSNQAALDVAVVALFGINFIYSVGFAGCCFCYSAETSPLHVRSFVNGFAVATTWSVNFLIAMVSPVAMSSIGYKYYIVWAAVNGFLITPFVYFFFPETKRRSLEEIDDIFLQSRSFFDTVGIARRMPYHNQAKSINGLDEENGMSTTPVENISVTAETLEKK